MEKIVILTAHKDKHTKITFINFVWPSFEKVPGGQNQDSCMQEICAELLFSLEYDRS